MQQLKSVKGLLWWTATANVWAGECQDKNGSLGSFVYSMPCETRAQSGEMSDSTWSRWGEGKQLHVWHWLPRTDRSGPDKEGWEEGLKLDLTSGEWGEGLCYFSHIEESTCYFHLLARVLCYNFNLWGVLTPPVQIPGFTRHARLCTQTLRPSSVRFLLFLCCITSSY